MATPNDVASWMFGKLLNDGVLYQDYAAAEIETNFGVSFIYVNDAGNIAIDKRVLAAFREISEKSVVWERSGRFWRKRESFDMPGRQQD